MLVLAIPIPICLSARDMRLSRVSQGLLYGFAIATLLACIFATSSHVNLVSCRGPSLSNRSLPASLVTAPEGAIGYHQPPSGPATDRTQPIETSGVSPKPTITPAARCDARIDELAHLRFRYDHVVLVTGTATATNIDKAVEATATAMADRSRALNTAGLLLSILLSILHL